MYQAGLDTPPEVKDRLLHLAPPTTKKEAQCLGDHDGFWRQHSPHVAVLLQPIYQVIRRAASLRGSQNYRRFTTGFSCWASCSALGPHDAADPTVPERSLADRDAV